MGFYYLVNEPYRGGDLSKVRENASKHGVPITQNWWRKIFKQCLEGLHHLHEHGFIHCDIKEQNLMLKTNNVQEPEVVIIDFGVAQDLVSDRHQFCGTPGYIAPETLDTTTWHPKGDCFSLGVTMMQLVIDQIPEVGNGPDGAPTMLKMGIFSDGARNLDEVHQMTRVRRPPFHRMPKECVALTQLLEKLLEKKMANRITASRALMDAWFTVPSVGDQPLPITPTPMTSRQELVPSAAPRPPATPLQVPRALAPSVPVAVRPTPTPVIRNAAYVVPGPSRPIHGPAFCAPFIVR